MQRLSPSHPAYPLLAQVNSVVAQVAQLAGKSSRDAASMSALLNGIMPQLEYLQSIGAYTDGEIERVSGYIPYIWVFLTFFRLNRLLANILILARARLRLARRRRRPRRVIAAPHLHPLLHPRRTHRVKHGTISQLMLPRVKHLPPSRATPTPGSCDNPIYIVLPTRARLLVLLASMSHLSASRCIIPSVMEASRLLP